MEQGSIIDINNKLRHSEDYYFLKREAIKLIEGLSGKIWSDYNTHDPGITLLESLCYALTDLGYRTSMDMKDLLASGSHSNSIGDLFYTAREILPCNPVTLTDYRKLIVDTQGIRNAWIEVCRQSEVPLFIEVNNGGEKHTKYHLSYDPERAAAALELNGLYKVFIEFDADIKTDEQKENLISVIQDKLHFHRNLCEDFVSISPVEYELFTIKATLKVSEGTDIEMINAQVFKVIHDFISSPVKFHTLEQMHARGFTNEQIFEGPILKHGFIIDKELEASGKYDPIHVSDIVYLLLTIEGVIAVTDLSVPADNDTSFSDFNEWLTTVQTRQKKPRIDTENSIISFTRSGDRHRNDAEKFADIKKVNSLLSFMLLTDARSRLKSYVNDINVEKGMNMDVTSYYPVQHTLPAIYGMQEKIFDTDIDEESIESAIKELHHHKKHNGGLSSKTTLIAHVAQLMGIPLEEIPSTVDIDNFKTAYFNQQFINLDTNKKSTLQLKGFLLPFEQLLSDYLLQLSSIRTIFSFQKTTQPEYSINILNGIHDLEALIIDYKKFLSEHSKLIDTDKGRFERQISILRHLLARFSEDMYVVSDNYNITYSVNQQTTDQKYRLLKDYIQVSNYRGKSYTFNKPGDIWNSNNVEGAKKRICRLTGIKDYSRRYTTSDALFIEEIELENGVNRYLAVLVDPDDRKHILLRSDEYEFASEAAETLQYILIHGSDKKLYELDEKKGKGYYFLMRKSQENEKEIVATYRQHEAREAAIALKRCIQILTDFSEDENFHVLEHILLRPKIEERDSMRSRSIANEADILQLLHVNESTIELPAPSAVQEEGTFKFKITNKQKGKNVGKPVWIVQLVRTESEEIILNIPDTFIFYNHALERMVHIKKAAADQENYQHKLNADGFHLFSILSNDHVLAEVKKKFSNEEEAEIIKQELIDFFSYESKDKAPTAESDEPGLGSLLDPYSFQLSYILPNWPRRFRDISFRHLLEKAIFLETPAHITPIVYWATYQQMRAFEEAYRYWIEELAETGIPSAETTNKLIHAMNKLKEER